MPWPDAIDAVPVAPAGSLGGSTPPHRAHHDLIRTALIEVKTKVNTLGSSSGAAPNVVYVAAVNASAAEIAIADYTCDGTADNVQIQAAIDFARTTANGVTSVQLSSGTFTLAAEVNLLGADDVNVENWVELVGAGPKRTTITSTGLTASIKLGAVFKGRLAGFTVECIGAAHGVRAVATNNSTAGYRSFWGSTFEDLNFTGPFDGSHTGWALHLESPFRSTFRNIEIGGVGNGTRLFSSNDNFNPGDCTFERCFADLFGNTRVAYSIESTAAVGNMNQVVFTMCEAIASGTGCKGIYIGGSGGTPGPVNYIEFIGCNLEQFDTLVDIDRGVGNTIGLNYVENRAANSLTAIHFGTNAWNNRISRIGMLYRGANSLVFVDDDNTGATGSPNIVEHARIYADTGSTITTSANPTATTILRDISVEGAGSVAAGISSARVRSGNGTPEAAITAPVGSLYLRTDGGAGTTLYRKESGSGNTGWVASPAVGTTSGTVAAGDDARIIGISFEVAGRVGTLTAETAGTTKTPRLFNRTGRTWTITAVYCSVDTAPTGSGITAVLRKNGSGTGAISTTISAAASTGSTTGQSLSVADGDYLQGWPTAVGSTIAGTDLSMLIVGTTA